MVRRRVLALLAVAVAAFGIGLSCGARHQSTGERAARTFAKALERGDTEAMHATLSADARKRFPLAAFRRVYERARMTPTSRGLAVGEVRKDGDTLAVPVTVRTDVFGT